MDGNTNTEQLMKSMNMKNELGSNATNPVVYVVWGLGKLYLRTCIVVEALNFVAKHFGGVPPATTPAKKSHL